MLEPGLWIVGNRIWRRRHRAVFIDDHALGAQRAEIQEDGGGARPAIEGEADRAGPRVRALLQTGDRENGGLRIAALVVEATGSDRDERGDGTVGHRAAPELDAPFACARV